MPEDKNAELFIQLYSKLSMALGVMPSKESTLRHVPEKPSRFLFRQPGFTRRFAAAEERPQSLLAILNPGKFIPGTLKPDTDMRDLYDLSILFNEVPQFNFVFKPAAGTVSNVYKSILDYKETPISTLSPDQKKRLDEAYAVVFTDVNTGDPTAQYVKYMDYQSAYYVAADNYDSAYATWLNDPSKPYPEAQKKAMERADKDWEQRGFKTKIDSAFATIVALEGLGPEFLWSSLLNRYKAGTKLAPLGSEFQVVNTMPRYKDWFGPGGWTHFEFNQTDMDNQSRSEAIGVAGNLDMEFGIVRVSGNGQYEQDSTYEKVDQTDITFKADLMRVALDRPWMNPLILSSRAWRWAKGSPPFGTVLSTGCGNWDYPATGAMTVVPTNAILSKNVEIVGSFVQTFKETFDRVIAVEASVGIGPFSITGRFNMENHDAYYKGTIAGNTVSAPDTQVIALICEVLPMLPDPDPNLVWPS